MKSYIVSLSLLLAFSNACLAQETRKTDDALLVEYYQTSNFADAFNYLKTVYKEPVTNSKELSRLAYTASMAGKLPEAESFYQRMYDRDTTDKTSLYNMAIINQRRGNNGKAERYLKKYTLLDSSNFSVYKQLAGLMAPKADFMLQIYYLQKANKIDSTEFDVASDLSDLYVKLQQFAAAEKVLSVAIAADPENIVLLQSLLKLTSAQKNGR
jgi:Tfp pilus assembly protein PilF